MDRTYIGMIGMGIALLMVFLRVPIGVAMGLVGIVGIAVLSTWSAAFSIAKSIPYTLIGDWNLSAVPMFLLMGYIASATGLTNGLFASARLFLGRACIFDSAGQRAVRLGLWLERGHSRRVCPYLGARNAQGPL